MATKKTNKKAAKKAAKKPAKKAAKKPAKKPAQKATRSTRRAGPAAAVARGSDVPHLFRINVEVGDLAAAASFYGTLLDTEGRMDRGARCYFEAGPVTLQVVDVSADRRPHPAAIALYFVARDLDAVFVRARSLGCLAVDDVHGAPAGEISVRPWGERSFYAEDPWGNPLCFVAAGTVYEP